LGVISFPLNQSLAQLRQQVRQQQETNQLRSTIRQVWRDSLGNDDAEDPSTAYIDQINTSTDDDMLNVQLQVVTGTLFTKSDQQRFTEKLAQALDRDPSRLNIRLVQIPIGQIVDPQASPLPAPSIFASVPDLKQQLSEAVELSLVQVSFPPSLPLISYQVILRDDPSPLEIIAVYLGDRDLQSDAQAILSAQIQAILKVDNLQVQYQRIPQQQGTMAATMADTPFSPQEKALLDKIGNTLQSYPRLNLKLTVERDPNISPASLLAQTEALRNYWTENWQISANRLQEIDQVGTRNQFQFSLVLDNEFNSALPETPQPDSDNDAPSP